MSSVFFGVCVYVCVCVCVWWWWWWWWGGVTVKTSHEKQNKQQQKHHVQKQPTYMSELQKSTSNSTKHCDTAISYHHTHMSIYTAESQLLPTPHTLKLKCDRLIPSMQIVAKTYDICVFFSIQT